MHVRCALTVFVFVQMVGCNLHPIQGLDEAIEAVRVERVAGGGSNKIDILFVIDDSNSMVEEQQLLTENFQLFLDGLTAAGADLHIAVVTTDTKSSNAGVFRSGPGLSELADDFCAGPPPALADCDVGTSVLKSDAYTDENGVLDIESFSRDFACIATVGNCGHFVEAGLDAMQLGLDPERAQVADFIRDDAVLAVVFVTDEDDCSTGAGRPLQENRECFVTRRDELVAVEQYRDFLIEDVKGGFGSAVIVGAIIAPTPPGYQWAEGVLSCTATTVAGVSGTAGQRYNELIRLFGGRGVEGSICEGDFSSVLRQISNEIGRNIDVNCLTENIPTCTQASDCSNGAECVPVFLTDEVPIEATPDKFVCSDFELSIEVKNLGEEDFTVWTGNGPAGDTLRDEYTTPEGAQFEVVYYADRTGSCPNSGVGFRFLERPSPTADVRALYPVSFDDD